MMASVLRETLLPGNHDKDRKSIDDNRDNDKNDKTMIRVTTK